jgi:hypothetical protein
MREVIKEIAKNHMMEYVHETNLIRFSEDLAREFCRKLELNGYDDASNVLKKQFEIED